MRSVGMRRASARDTSRVAVRHHHHPALARFLRRIKARVYVERHGIQIECPGPSKRLVEHGVGETLDVPRDVPPAGRERRVARKQAKALEVFD